MKHTCKTRAAHDDPLFEAAKKAENQKEAE